MAFFSDLFKKYTIIALALFFSVSSFSKEKAVDSLSKKSPSIYSSHWHGNRPISTAKNNEQEMLLVYDLFTVSFDPQKRFSRWLAYQLSPYLVWGFLKAERHFKKDIYLLDNNHTSIALSFKDYKGASKLNYDKGHLAPLGSFKASVFSYQLQYLSNVVPQLENLNRGPWKTLESKVRKFVKKGNELKIIAGVLYGDNNYGKPYKKARPPWSTINGKVEQLPSGFWKIIAFKDKGVIQTCSFIMPQEISNRMASIKKYIVTTAVLKKYTALSFFEGVKAPVKDNCSFLN